MGSKTFAVLAVIILYMVYGTMMYMLEPAQGPIVILTGPARMLWNLVFGFMFEV